MKSPTVRSNISIALYREIPFDPKEFLEIIQVHQVPDIVWLGEHRDAAIRVRDPLPAEVKWLALAPGATVAVAAKAPGVVFAYIEGEGDESELVAMVMQYYPDFSQLS